MQREAELGTCYRVHRHQRRMREPLVQVLDDDARVVEHQVAIDQCRQRVVRIQVEQVSHGRLTPEEFDRFVRDTTNFLAYAGEPSQLQRRAIGIWVVLFLVVFTLFAWMLKKEFWKDVQ